MSVTSLCAPFPGFVRCAFADANRNRHTFIEKIPVVTTEDLWNDSVYLMFLAQMFPFLAGFFVCAAISQLIRHTSSTLWIDFSGIGVQQRRVHVARTRERRKLQE